MNSIREQYQKKEMRQEKKRKQYLQENMPQYSKL